MVADCSLAAYWHMSPRPVTWHEHWFSGLNDLRAASRWSRGRTSSRRARGVAGLTGRVTRGARAGGALRLRLTDPYPLDTMMAMKFSASCCHPVAIGGTQVGCAHAVACLLRIECIQAAVDVVISLGLLLRHLNMVFSFCCSTSHQFKPGSIPIHPAAWLWHIKNTVMCVTDVSSYWKTEKLSSDR